MDGNGDNMWSARVRIRIVWLWERHRRGDELLGSYQWPVPQLADLKSCHQ